MPLVGWTDGLLRGKLNGGHFHHHLETGVLELAAEDLSRRGIGDGLEVHGLREKGISDFPPLEFLQLPGPRWPILVFVCILAIRFVKTGLGVCQLALKKPVFNGTFLLLDGGQDIGVECLPVLVLSSIANDPASVYTLRFWGCFGSSH
jgi:hypothetical protein